MIAAEHDTGPFVASLIESPLPPDHPVVAYRQPRSLLDFVNAWTTHLGVKASIDYKSPAEMKASLDAVAPGTGLGDDVSEVMAFGEEFGFGGEKVNANLRQPKDVSKSFHLLCVWIMLMTV